MTDKKKDLFVVAITSDEMGRGSPDLGRILMKSFIGALTEYDRLPDHLLFLNGGVQLTTKGSNALEALRELDDRGVQIYSCGTCLNFFELGQPEVGGISNMATTLELMAEAGRLINL